MSNALKVYAITGMILLYIAIWFYLRRVARKILLSKPPTADGDVGQGATMHTGDQTEQQFWDGVLFNAIQKGVNTDQAVVEANAAIAARRLAFPPTPTTTA